MDREERETEGRDMDSDEIDMSESRCERDGDEEDEEDITELRVDPAREFNCDTFHAMISLPLCTQGNSETWPSINSVRNCGVLAKIAGKPR